jgi:hypothetical protein
MNCAGCAHSNSNKVLHVSPNLGPAAVGQLQCITVRLFITSGLAAYLVARSSWKS